jgi:hypothetical protein
MTRCESRVLALVLTLTVAALLLGLWVGLT